METEQTRAKLDTVQSTLTSACIKNEVLFFGADAGGKKE